MKFLLDSGASISVIFLDYVDKQKINKNDRIKINGVSGSTTTFGSTELTFKVNGCKISHTFFILDSFDYNVQGILGADFFDAYSAILNYETFSMSINLNNEKINIPMESEKNNTIVIPSRCEIIKYFNVGHNKECVVLPNEIGNGVLIASVIVRPKNGEIPVKILNSREEEVTIKNFRPETVDLDTFDVVQFTGNNISSVKRVDEVLGLVNYKNMNREEQSAIEHIIAKFADVFYLPKDPLSVTNIYKHNIQLEKNASPVYVKPYRLPQAQKEEINKQVGKMLDEGVIEPAQSPWSSPILIVPKKVDKNGERKWRLVIDYRLLNKTTKDDKFPLPNITEILDSLAGAIYFSHLDLAQGYYQVELDKKCREYTAFTTNQGQFQLTRLPMGLKISPSVFSRVMTMAMSGLNYESCFVYLDDLIVFGRNLLEHNMNLVKVLGRLRKVNLKLNPIKCNFLQKEILYLGHIISDKGVAPDPEKITTIQHFPTPQDAQAVKRFVAFANYYRSFIPNFAHLSAPLNKLTRKNQVFNWTQECQEAFEILKTKLTVSPVLQYPDFSKNNTFILKTDASGVAVGAVLCNSNDKPVAYASRTLNKAEKNYCTIEKELLGIVWAVKHFRPYLYGRKFSIQTDHRPLVYLFNMTNPSSRLTKFRLILEEYDFEVSYIKGKANVTADALSRIEIPSEIQSALQTAQDTVNVITRSKAKELENHVDSNTDKTRTDHPGVVHLLKKPKNVTELKIIKLDEYNKYVRLKDKYNLCKENVIYDAEIQIIYMNEANTCSTSKLRASLKDCQQICINHNLKEIVIVNDKNSAEIIKEILNLRKIFKEADIKISILKGVQKIEDMPTRQLILNDFHMLPTGGHAGINRMFNNIKKYYYWEGLYRDTERFIRRCDDCQRYKHCRPNTEPMKLTDTASAAFEKIFLDLVGPLETDELDNKYILTIQCDLTKYVEAYPLKNKEAVSVATAFVNNFILRYGIPMVVVTDRGTEFISSVFIESCKILRIKQMSSTAYHHQTLGALENSHKHLGAYLRMQVARGKGNWSACIPFWCFAYNVTVHTETKYTPYELVFGRVARLPTDISDKIDPLYSFENYPLELKFRLQQAISDARNNLINSKIKRKDWYDQKCKSYISYKKGDLVLVQNNVTNKLQELFKGPYTVIREETPNIVILVNNKEQLVHKNRVKLYHN